LDDYLLQPDAIQSPCFRDHHGRAVALIPTDSRVGSGRSQEKSSLVSRGSGKLFHLPVATSPSPREPRSSGLLSPTS
jgi:hypothetical protein